MINIWDKKTPDSDAGIGNVASGIEFYPAKGNNPNAAVIICAGGAYEFKSYHEGEPVAKWLNSLGITAFVLDYRVAPCRYPMPMLDLKRAMRYVRYNSEKYSIYPDKIGVLGFSAGGHLTAAVATDFDMGDSEAEDPVERLGCKPDAIILCYPVITTGRYTHQGSLENLLGKKPEKELKKLLSLENRVKKDTPCTFIWHTANDELVPVENSLKFAAALSAKGVEFELHVLPDGVHGLGLADDLPRVRIWKDYCAEWLKSIGFC